MHTISSLRTRLPVGQLRLGGVPDTGGRQWLLLLLLLMKLLWQLLLLHVLLMEGQRRGERRSPRAGQGRELCSKLLGGILWAAD